MPANETAFPFKKILVGLTRSEPDADLLAYARMLADSPGKMEFHFMHVLGVPEYEPDPPPVATGPESYAEIGEAVQRHFGPPSERVTTKCSVVQGSRIDRLLELADREGNDLILIGHRRLRTGRRSTARRLAMKAPCSLWLAPSGSPAAITRILGAVDFSFSSAHALTVAAAIAASRGLPECVSLNVHFNQLTIGGGEPGSSMRRVKDVEFQRFLRPLNLHGVPVRPIVEESYRVPEAIANTAAREGADLIVMGTRGRSPSAAVLLGSESEQTIMESWIPVLVVKAQGERSGILQALLERSTRNELVSVS
jgi:nucleotide-binding universal stress UspA family protein